MGRGDNRTKRGKIFSGTFGVSRPARVKKTTGSANAATTKSAKKAKA